jgi:threonine synthase
LTNKPGFLQPYNFERLLFYLTDGDQHLVHAWMTTVDQTAKLDLDSSWVEKMLLRFDSARVTDDEMCDTMRKVLEKFNYFADPHTSVALAAAEKLGYFIDGGYVGLPTAVLATASPCKFEESVTVALGEKGWKDYKEKLFPANAAELATKVEVAPVVYSIVDGEPLSEIQLGWEAQARQHLDQLAGRK